jgi:hypothetical protein
LRWDDGSMRSTNEQEGLGDTFDLLSKILASQERKSIGGTDGHYYRISDNRQIDEKVLDN